MYNHSIFRLLLTVLLSAAGVINAGATVFYVGLTGDDANDGRSPATAFRTVQRGVDALSAGDELTILPGEYFETVLREGLGSMEEETVIRAAIPGTVVLRGDEPVSGFVQEDGFRWVYSAAVEGPVQGVFEVDTLTPLRRVASAAEVEFAPGSFYHDPEAGRLYVASTDIQKPLHHKYRVARFDRDGLCIFNPTRVRVSGLTVTGYKTDQLNRHFPGSQRIWGLILADPNHCVIEDCVAYLTGGGIAIHRRGDGTSNLIDRCRVYGTWGGGIRGFSADGDEIRDCVAFLCGGTGGIQFYGAGNRGPAMMRRNLAWGNPTSDIRIKGGAREFHFAENCVAFGNLDVYNTTTSVVGYDNAYNRDTGIDVIWFGREEDFDPQREFVDFDNMDFRLQSTSRFRGTGIDGTDRGAFPFEANVFFVSPDGNDSAEGMSLDTAWKSLQVALSRLRAGDTLYLLAGNYTLDAPVSIGTSGDKEISIRGHSLSEVTISGNIKLEDSHGVTFERINFGAQVAIVGGDGFAFSNCRFFGQPSGLDLVNANGVRVVHSVFDGFDVAAIHARATSGVFLQANLFNNHNAPALDLDTTAVLLYSDGNGFADRSNAIRANEDARSGAGFAPAHDRYSVDVDASVFAGTAEGISQIWGVSPDGWGLGPSRFNAKHEIAVTEPVIHRVSDVTADIEWWTSAPARCVVEWGPADAAWARETTITSDGYVSLSLTDLEPGKEYTLRVREVEPDRYARSRGMVGVQPDLSLAFATLREPAAPVTYYVSTEGSDSNSGLSVEQPLRTISRAASLAGAGDTVVIREGVYPESVRVRSTGTPGRPITFRAAAGEKVVLDGNRRLITTAIHINGKNYINIDGLYFRQTGMVGWDGVINIVESDHVTISRCFYNGIGAGYAARFISAISSAWLTIDNCVFANGFEGLVARGCSDLVVRNCVFLRNLIQGMIISNNPEQSVTLLNNVFADSHTGKARVSYLEIARVESVKEDNNLFFMRLPDEERKIWCFYGNEEYERAMPSSGTPIVYPREPLISELTYMSLGEYQKRFAPDSTSLFGDPRFAVVDRLDAEVREGYTGDIIANNKIPLDFPELFVTAPELEGRGIGLNPAVFADFHFNSNQ